VSFLPPLALVVSTLVQASQAAVMGTIHDEESGAPLAGAEVVLSDLSRTTTAGADGGYVFADVPAGPQHLAVRYIGYMPRVLHALVPREGALEINVALRASPLHLRTIEVHPPVVVRGLEPGESPFPDRSLSIAAIRNHPLLAEPDAFEALGGGAVALRPESPGGVHVYGGSADETGYLLDGIPVLSPYHSAGLFTAWNPDALAGVTLSSTAQAGALSGAVAGVTRAPGERVRSQGALSTAQTRLTLDGPVGIEGAGFLLSVRSGFPGGFGGEADPSRIRGETGDRLAKLEAPVLGGALRLLAYDNANELDAAAVAESGRGDTTTAGRRNRYEWGGTSLGGEWRRAMRSGEIRIVGWSAAGDASAAWSSADGPVAMASTRNDLGMLAAIARHTARTRTELGLRLERSTTDYRIGSDSGGAPYELLAHTPIAAAFVRHARPVGHGLALAVGSMAAVTSGKLRVDPDARLEWQAAEDVRLSASWVRRHQFTQSLRNPESLVGNVFPADLFVGSATPGVPVARSDLAVLAAEVRPSPGFRLGAEVYGRRLEGLVLVAPASGEPFGTAGFATGSGTVYGASLDASFATVRYAVVASYGFQRSRLQDQGVRYVPEYSAAHLFEGGIILFPTATSSIRIGLTGAAGRRGTSPLDAVEWESCNLRDKGCELGGSPRYDPAALGAASLPAYLRLDLGVRQHWHLQVGGRDAVVAVFGTMTNLFGRTNVLSYTYDPLTGARSSVDMRPRAPLVVGLEWQY
jgi:hypothetical protein